MRKGREGGRPDDLSNLAWWRASTLRTIARRGHLARKWVALRPLTAAWGRVVDAVAQHTASWPEHLARVVAAVPATDEGQAALGWADQPRRPWIPRGAGPDVPPVMRPLLDTLSDAVSPQVAAFDALLEEPAEEEPPAKPKTTAASRAQYREQASKTKTLESALFKDHLLRERAIAIVSGAEVAFVSLWWSTWPGRAAGLAGDRPGALRLARRMRSEGLSILRSAFEAAPVARPAAKRPKTAKAKSAKTATKPKAKTPRRARR